MLEAESGVRTNMSVGVSGGCSYIYGGDWQTGWSDYTFTAAAGTYRLHGVVANPGGVGSFYYRLDAQAVKLWYYTPGDANWHWDTDDETLPLATGGQHTLRIYGGRPNSRLDVIEINLGATPTFNGSTCLGSLAQIFKQPQREPRHLEAVLARLRRLFAPLMTRRRL